MEGLYRKRLHNQCKIANLFSKSTVFVFFTWTCNAKPKTHSLNRIMIKKPHLKPFANANSLLFSAFLGGVIHNTNSQYTVSDLRDYTRRGYVIHGTLQ